MKRIVEVKTVGCKIPYRSFYKVIFEFQEEVKCLVLKKIKRKAKKLKVRIRNDLDELGDGKLKVLREVYV